VYPTINRLQGSNIDYDAAGKIWYFGALSGSNTGLVSQYKQYQVSPYSELLIRDYT